MPAAEPTRAANSWKSSALKEKTARAAAADQALTPIQQLYGRKGCLAARTETGRGSCHAP